MDTHSGLISQFKLLLGVWPGTGFEGGRMGTAGGEGLARASGMAA